MEDIVREKDREIEELRKQLEEAKSENKAKEVFLSSMSHDIRTPMNAIIGMTAIAKKYIDEKSRVQDALNKIETASSHLMNLLNGVLDMSRINAGKMHISQDVFSLSDLLHEIVSMVHPLIERRKQNWKLELQDIEIEQFYGDALRIKQIYVNIITNAIKYTNDGGNITVSISEKVDDSSCLLSFICRDNGIGMSKDFLSRIFLPFERVNNSTVSKIEGSGLGMSIVKSLVEAMSGTIAVDSEVGEGTEVRVDIPLRFEKIKVETENLEGKRILVIEADAKLSERYSEIFSQYDLTYEIVPSAAQAVSSITEADFCGNGYDIAIIGCVMENSGSVTDVSGYLHKVKPDLSIVLVSDDDWEELEYRAIRSGIQLFIPTPFFRKSLINGLNRVAGQSKSGRDNLSMPNLEDKHILLVEDNMINQMIALEILESTKAKIDTAENGKQAVNAFESSEKGYYDIIFMDIQMPVMDGYEAASLIRASNREDGKTVPIYAMTANTFAEDIAKARSCGMNGHIAKPIDINNVMQVLRHL